MKPGFTIDVAAAVELAASVAYAALLWWAVPKFANWFADGSYAAATCAVLLGAGLYITAPVGAGVCRLLRWTFLS